MTSTGSVGIERLDPLEQVEPFLPGRRVARVVQIEDREIEVGRLDSLERLGRRARLDDLEPLVEEQQPQRVEDVRLIVGDQHPDGSRLGIGQRY